jgi:hypothetical protein
MNIHTAFRDCTERNVLCSLYGLCNVQLKIKMTICTRKHISLTVAQELLSSR